MPLHITATFMDKGPPRTRQKTTDDGSKDKRLIIDFSGAVPAPISTETIMEIVGTHRKDWMASEPDIEIRGTRLVAQF